MERKILKWLAKGATGSSSKYMAFTALGIKTKYISYPFDPADLNRCIILTKKVPEILGSLDLVAKSCPQWGQIIHNWDFLVTLLHQEAGENWEKQKSAPKTYKEMKRLFDNC